MYVETFEEKVRNIEKTGSIPEPGSARILLYAIIGSTCVSSALLPRPDFAFRGFTCF